MTAAKIRIYELAKELGLTNKELIDLLEKQFGVAAKSHSSSVEADVADKARQFCASKKGESKPVAESSAPQKAEVEKTASKPATTKASEPTKPADPVSAPPKQSTVAKPSSEPVSPAKPSVAAASTTTAPSAKPLPPKMPAQTSPASQSAVATASPKSAVAVQEVPVKPAEPSQKVETFAKPIEHETRPAAKKDQPIVDPDAPPLVVVQIEAPMTIGELAQKLSKRETELIRHLFMKGVMVTVNQTMQLEDAIALANEMGFDARGPEEKAKTDKDAAPLVHVKHTKGKHLRPRAPVVSIMGHVDHGKTSLLDAIRETRHKIVDTEAGGITQSIGAYTVEKDDHKIVFIDTPGHAAFTAMRMRGAQSTDIAILVVAADDGVMPQTIEAISHAKAANIPIIVAINKIDKPGADPDKVLIQLADYGLNPEKWGGDTITVEVSAIQKLGLEDLLEMIILVSELQELKADSTIPAEGIVIEARRDKGMGPVATVLIQNGTLHIGENIIINKVGGRVRALIDDYGQRIKSAGPSTPVEILGLNDVPLAGEFLEVIRNDKEFKRLLQTRQVVDRDQRLSKIAAPGLMNDSREGQQRQEFFLIIKADTQGSVEAVTSSLLQLATEEVSIHILHGAAGDVSEADVLLASASNAMIIAFNVKEESTAQKVAQDAGISVRYYDIIYKVLEDIEKMMLGMLSPETEEEEIGIVEVRQLFSFGKTSIAGCYVTEGKVVRNGLSRVFRNGKEIHKGQLNNLKRFKDDAKEVAAGYECGVSFDKFNDLQVGDLIKVYAIKEIERTSL